LIGVVSDNFNYDFTHLIIKHSEITNARQTICTIPIPKSMANQKGSLGDLSIFLYEIS